MSVASGDVIFKTVEDDCNSWTYRKRKYFKRVFNAYRKFCVLLFTRSNRYAMQLYKIAVETAIE